MANKMLGSGWGCVRKRGKNKRDIERGQVLYVNEEITSNVRLGGTTYVKIKGQGTEKGWLPTFPSG